MTPSYDKGRLSGKRSIITAQWSHTSPTTVTRVEVVKFSHNFERNYFKKAQKSLGDSITGWLLIDQWPNSEANILGPWINISQRKASCYRQAYICHKTGLDGNPVQVFQMAAPGTLEDLPHPGSWSSKNLDHRGFWTASHWLPATIWANVSALPATGGNCDWHRAPRLKQVPSTGYGTHQAKPPWNNQGHNIPKLAPSTAHLSNIIVGWLWRRISLRSESTN